jgi:predicted transposase/invertase (TIGR01784 family)
MTLGEQLRSEGRQEGRQQGRQEGRFEGKLEVATRLLAAGIDLAFIASITEIHLDTIKSLEMKIDS